MSWNLIESGPADADHSVLLLPGALCTAQFYRDLMAEPELADVRLIAATLPGHGGTPPPEDFSIENYARLAAELAAQFECDAVLGHSVGANVALEMVASGLFDGPVVLLSPSLSRRDESIVPRVLDRLGRVLGDLPFTAMLTVIGPAMKGSLPAESQEMLIAELRKNDPRVTRRHLRSYLQYLDQHGSVATRLCQAGRRAWVLYGEHDDVSITDQERSTLESCPRTTVITVPGSSHMIANMAPARVAEILIEALVPTC
ncbi:alpha/beta hydrolase [Nocardia uniformis]|uniref:Alpha/beta hydrolase n=1 Tax=Nocardia uniformis TaxID=53432 RepID=A0A849CBP5_9NOCA|nr:alpha/beta hydrolase [Nocardia uniformis]NNH72349.1 alpha/beta hydrolase [Nocardia uniformis]